MKDRCALSVAVVVALEKSAVSLQKRRLAALGITGA